MKYEIDFIRLFIDQSANSLWNQKCIRDIHILLIWVIENTVVLFTLFEVLVIVWNSWWNYVISNYDCSFLYQSSFIKPFEIWKIKRFPVIDENHIKWTMILQKLFVFLNSSIMARNQIWKTCMFMDFSSNSCCVLVWIKSMNFSLWIKGKNKRRVATKSSKLKNILRFVVIYHILNDLCFISSNIHHPIVLTKLVNTIDSCFGIFSWSFLKDKGKKFASKIITFVNLHFSNWFFSLVFVALWVWHIFWDWIIWPSDFIEKYWPR